MFLFLSRIHRFIYRRLWEADLPSLSKPHRLAVRFLRVIYIGIREFQSNQLTLRAMSLVYTTLLGFVPFLAVSFSVLKAFGVHNQLEPLLVNFLAPLGPQGEQIANRIIGFVENINVGVLGSVGLLFLIYTVITLVQKIEEALNFIWKIRRERSFAEKFSDYMSVLLIGPVLVFAALGLTTSLMNRAVVQELMELRYVGHLFIILGRLVPYFFIIAAFTFVYSYLPSTKVKFRPALVGGAFAGIMWQTVGWVFASFIATSARYSAIYSGFAILIIFMIWLFLNWRVFLVGASVSFYNQYPQLLAAKREVLILSNRLKERIALVVMYLVASNFHYNRPPWNIEALVDRLGIPMEPVNSVIILLEKKGFLYESSEETGSVFLPARSIEKISVMEVLDGIRSAEEDIFGLEQGTLAIPAIEGELQKINNALQNAIAGATLRDLVLSEGAGAEDPPI